MKESGRSPGANGNLWSVTSMRREQDQALALFSRDKLHPRTTDLHHEIIHADKRHAPIRRALPKSAVNLRHATLRGTQYQQNAPLTGGCPRRPEQPQSPPCRPPCSTPASRRRGRPCDCAPPTGCSARAPASSVVVQIQTGKSTLCQLVSPSAVLRKGYRNTCNRQRAAEKACERGLSQNTNNRLFST